jgi:predicted metal-dependent hydrolase
MSDPGSHFARGVELIRERSFFEAHEELELAWRKAPVEERDFYQGLVHVAVGWYQAGRANRYGCERQLAKAARRLGPYAPAHRGVDVGDVLMQIGNAQAAVAAGSLALEPPRL